MGDEALEAGFHNGFADARVVEFLGVVDLVPAGDAASVEMGEVGDVLFNR